MPVLHAKLSVLREELHRRFPTACPRQFPQPSPRARLLTGHEGVDELLDGGLVRGQVTAWFGPHGVGLASMARTVTLETLCAGHRVALVDAGRSLEPADWCDMEGQDRLWIVRPERVRQAFTAGEILMACGGFALVVIDLVHISGGGLRQVSHHLKRASEAGASALLLLGEGTVAAQPHVSLRLAPVGLGQGGRWRVQVCRVDGLARSLAPQEVCFDARQRLAPARLPRIAPFPDRRLRAMRSRREGFELGGDPGAG